MLSSICTECYLSKEKYKFVVTSKYSTFYIYFLGPSLNNVIATQRFSLDYEQLQSDSFEK